MRGGTSQRGGGAEAGRDVALAGPDFRFRSHPAPGFGFCGTTVMVVLAREPASLGTSHELALPYN